MQKMRFKNRLMFIITVIPAMMVLAGCYEKIDSQEETEDAGEKHNGSTGHTSSGTSGTTESHGEGPVTETESALAPEDDGVEQSSETDNAMTSTNGTASESGTGSPVELNCEDNIDNDGDGSTDCDDVDCASFDVCVHGVFVGTPEGDGWGDKEVFPGDALRACNQDEECARVEISCSGCCVMAAVNAESSEKYREAKGEICSGYNGPVCDCEAAESEIKCLDGLCENVIKEVSCEDGRDNDYDGAIDCDDTDCSTAASCTDEYSVQAQPDGDKLVVAGDSMRKCEEDTDCVILEISCSGCCYFDAIRDDRSEDFFQIQDEVCKDYDGDICYCDGPVGERRCVDGLCLFLSEY